MAHTETGYLVLGLWPTQKLVTSCWDCGPLRNWLPRVGTVVYTETGAVRTSCSDLDPHRNRYSTYFVLGLRPKQKPVQYVPRVGTLTHTETGTVRTSCWDCGPNRNRCSTYLVQGLWPAQKPVQYVPSVGPSHTETGTVRTSCWAIPHRNRYSTYFMLGHPTQKPVQYVPRVGTVATQSRETTHQALSSTSPRR